MNEASHPHQFVSVDKLTFCYEDVGDSANPVILLVMGLGAQMTLWPQSLVDGLVAAGFRVIRFDNRDIGLTSKIKARLPMRIPTMIARGVLGMTSPAPYSLHDMVEDTHGLMDALGIERAHIVGVSMGGMIAQLFAAKYPERLYSLTSIKSSTNYRWLPRPKPKALYRLLGGGEKPKTREQIIASSVRTWQVIGSPDYPIPEQETFVKLAYQYDRSHRPAGMMRQLASILATGDFDKVARTIKTPTLVIHGSKDPLIRLAAGKRTAKVIKGAKLHIIVGMGHDLPEALVPKIVGEISSHCRPLSADTP